MISACILTSGGSGAPKLLADLEAAGIAVAGVVEVETMVRDVIRSAADVLVCYENHPADALFEGIAALRNASPRPVIVFTNDPDADRIDQAARSGIHAYVVNGYGQNRLRSLIHVAQARFRQERRLHDQLTDVNSRFSERKIVDRAKGILMRVRNIAEDESYRVLRRAAMQSKQRIGQVAQQVIDATRYADAVNRAGQVRMLSQRLVKLYALTCAGIEPDSTASLRAQSVEAIDANLSTLGRALSQATFGDLIEAVAGPWSALKAALGPAPASSRLGSIDQLAERLLLQAEALTTNLETAGFEAALHVINVAGRQRMLSQRLAKQALLASLGAERAGLLPGSDPRDESAFLEGLAYLEASPLSSEEIRASLRAASETWASFRQALTQPSGRSRQTQIAVLSETLLAEFSRLTGLYERSIQVLMGDSTPPAGRIRSA